MAIRRVRAFSLAAVSVLAATARAQAGDAGRRRSFDFEAAADAGTGPAVPGWGGGGAGYEQALDTAEPHGGKQCARLRRVFATGDQAFGTLVQSADAQPYRQKRVRLSAFVRTQQLDGWFGL